MKSKFSTIHSVSATQRKFSKMLHSDITLIEDHESLLTYINHEILQYVRIGRYPRNVNDKTRCNLYAWYGIRVSRMHSCGMNRMCNVCCTRERDRETETETELWEEGKGGKIAYVATLYLPSVFRCDWLVASGRRTFPAICRAIRLCYTLINVYTKLRNVYT